MLKSQTVAMQEEKTERSSQASHVHKQATERAAKNIRLFVRAS